MRKLTDTFLKMLDYFSKILKTDLRYIFSGGSLLTLTQITSAIFGFLMTLAFANYLPQDEFGVYKYVLATYSLLSIISLPGIDTSLIDTISKGNTGAFKNAIFVKLRWGLLGSLASILYATYCLFAGDETLFYLFLFVSIFLPFMEAFSIYSSYYNAQKKYLDWMVTEFLNQALSTTALFLTIYFTHNIYALVTVYFLTYIILRFAIVIYIFKTNTFSQDYNKDYISYGKTMSWFQIITRSISTIDQIILFNLTGPAALAVFAIANSIPMRAQSVVKITATLAFPKYSRYTEEQILKTLPIKMFYFGVLLFMTSCFYAAIAPTLFKYLLPKYLNSVHYSQALIFFIVSAMTYPYSTYMVVFKKVKEQYIMALLNISVKILCLVIFIPLYGVWGAVFGVLAGSYSLIFSAYYFIWRNKKQLSGN